MSLPFLTGVLGPPPLANVDRARQSSPKACSLDIHVTQPPNRHYLPLVVCLEGLGHLPVHDQAGGCLGKRTMHVEFLVKNPTEIYCMRDLRERSHPEDSTIVLLICC